MWPSWIDDYFMMHYKIVLTGDSIIVDHYGTEPPAMGFVACRIVKAESEEMAVAVAKRDVLVQWNQSFNADRKAGLPQLTVDKVSTVRPWLTRKPKHDYYFYDSEEKHREHLHHFTRSRRRWFKKRVQKETAENE